jgi:radical SAM superfamily enzyme YgiQ (UPF0313 family)
MKILLLSPVISAEKKTPLYLTIPQLALHILAGLTAPEHSVTILEEEHRLVDLETDCDLVGISCMTSNAKRAYFIADAFRARGKKVVMGGIHPTILPDEALQHADSVVIGEAENVWETLLEDAKHGRLQPKYHRPEPTLDRFIPLGTRRDCKKRPFNVTICETSRGCPYKCEFCAVTDFYGKKIRHHPVANVIRDIEESGSRTIGFIDDNIVGDPRYSKELFQALKPLKVDWGGQGSISFSRSPDLLKLAAGSGCRAFYCGLESVAPSTMKRFSKSMKDLAALEEGIKRIKDHGIHFHASLIYGFDEDTTAVFPETLEFLYRNRISTATFHLLTPFPGTRLHEKLKAEGRILTEDWSHYNWDTVVYQPRLIAPEELLSGLIWMKTEFSKLTSVVARYLNGNLGHPLLHFGGNFGLRMEIKDHRKNMVTLKKDILNERGGLQLTPPDIEPG